MTKDNSKKVTGKKAASSASRVIRDGRTSKDSKTAAGSALSQRPGSSHKGVASRPRKK